MKTACAAILGVGTEVTTGQISNTNAQWLSKQLWTLGIPTSVQTAVPDDWDLIHQALVDCHKTADLLFVTGGLGPTTDDFTREVISKWSNLPLSFDPEAWTTLVGKIQARGVLVKDMHRQECFFPQGARVLNNPVGTASGFHLSLPNSKHVFVLPGPPKEIHGIWQDHIQSWLTDWARQIDPGLTWSWDNVGLPESEIATRVEEVLKGCPFEKAYRVHLPYVEFKLSARRSQQAEAAPWLQKITDVLAPWTVARDGEDPGATLIQHLLKVPGTLLVQDEKTGAFLWQRLIGVGKELLNSQKLSYTNQPGAAAQAACSLKIEATQDPHAVVAFASLGQEHSQWRIETPSAWLKFADRERQYWAEMAILHWRKWLQERPNSRP